MSMTNTSDLGIEQLIGPHLYEGGREFAQAVYDLACDLTRKRLARYVSVVTNDESDACEDAALRNVDAAKMVASSLLQMCPHSWGIDYSDEFKPYRLGAYAQSCLAVAAGIRQLMKGWRRQIVLSEVYLSGDEAATCAAWHNLCDALIKIANKSTEG